MILSFLRILIISTFLLLCFFYFIFPLSIPHFIIFHPKESTGILENIPGLRYNIICVCMDTIYFYQPLTLK